MVGTLQAGSTSLRGLSNSQLFSSPYVITVKQLNYPTGRNQRLRGSCSECRCIQYSLPLLGLLARALALGASRAYLRSITRAKATANLLTVEIRASGTLYRKKLVTARLKMSAFLLRERACCCTCSVYWIMHGRVLTPI
jgi:hypothetical protein